MLLCCERMIIHSFNWHKTEAGGYFSTALLSREAEQKAHLTPLKRKEPQQGILNTTLSEGRPLRIDASCKGLS